MKHLILALVLKSALKFVIHKQVNNSHNQLVYINIKYNNYAT